MIPCKMDGDKLRQKIGALSLMQTVALVDAVERWWLRVDNGENNLDVLAALEN